MPMPTIRLVRHSIVRAACLSVALVGMSVSSVNADELGGGAASAAVPQNLKHTGRWFTDTKGKVVVMHGTNMINKLSPYTPDALGFGDDDLQFLADNGFNGIRLGLTWAAVEPRPGEYDNAYIDKIVDLARKSAQHGLLPVVNFHQDGYSETYGGNGAPAWASLSYGVPGSPLPAPANVLPGAAIANENFWANAKASDGIGLQDHYAASWRHVAERFKGDTRTVFELANEPSPGYLDVAPCALPIGCPLFDKDKLAPFNRKVLAAVRRVDPTRLVFVEPSAFFGLGARTWLPATGDPQVGFAFHNYCALALVPTEAAVPTAPCDVLTGINYANAQSQFKKTGEPLLMNEFGAGDSDAVVGKVVDRADKHMLSWMHWAYWAQDFGHPATYGLINDPGQPPTAANIKQGLLKVLTRPSPRLIAGTPLNWGWDGATFQARYSTARADRGGTFPAGSTSRFFIHPRFFPTGYQVRITGGIATSAANAPNLEIRALPGATSVSVVVSPSGS